MMRTGTGGEGRGASMIVSRRRAFAAATIAAFAVSYMKLVRNALPTIASAGTSPPRRREFFTLCNKRIMVDDMPPLSSEYSAYGFRAWSRNTTGGALVLSQGPIHGQTGNNLREVFHAMEMARHSEKALVLRPGGFPLDRPLRQVFPGLDEERLENITGIMLSNKLSEEDERALTTIGTKRAFEYAKTPGQRLSLGSTLDAARLRERRHHRRFVLQKLYRMVAEELDGNDAARARMCASRDYYFDASGHPTMDVGRTYAAIHHRTLADDWFDQTVRFANASSHKLSSDIVVDVLESFDMANRSIVMVTDRADAALADELTHDTRTHSRFRVVPEHVSTMEGDMMLSILSDVFFGNPASTFTQYIAQVRHALGLGPSVLFYAWEGWRGRWSAARTSERDFYDIYNA